jgi:hypothetical protein
VTQIPTDSRTWTTTRAKSRFFREFGATLSAGALLALLLGTLAAVNPALHSWLHSDAKQPGHQCFAKLVENHQLIAGDLVTTVPLPTFHLELNVPHFSGFNPGKADFLLPPSRGPPVLVVL